MPVRLGGERHRGTVRPRRAAAGPELASRRDQPVTYSGAVCSGRRHLLLAGVWDADTALTSLAVPVDVLCLVRAPADVTVM
ncbi:hypothetical protein DMP15_25045 [Pseudonocardia sp. UM4_GMWB1]